jgi:hypothetical protein
MEMENVHPRRDVISVRIPALSFRVTFRVKDREEVLPMTVDTLLVEPEESRFALTFRCSLLVGEAWRYVKSARFERIA